MDRFCRYETSCRLSNSMEVDFCVDTLDEALDQGCPEIFTTDQGAQLTSRELTASLQREGIAISMDGKGREIDNAMIERLWRTLKYEWSPPRNAAQETIATKYFKSTCTTTITSVATHRWGAEHQWASLNQLGLMASALHLKCPAPLSRKKVPIYPSSSSASKTQGMPSRHSCSLNQGCPPSRHFPAAGMNRSTLSHLRPVMKTPRFRAV